MNTPTTSLAGVALLREAVKLMRQRAERATPSPWQEWREDETEGSGGQWFLCPPATGALLVEANRRPFQDRINDATHIASWHPAVALAVAAWLDTAGADLWAHGPLHCAEGCHECDDEMWMHHARRALAVARTYLGLAPEGSL